MTRRRTTMKDVAERAGVGIKTVSRVVNGEPNVSPTTAALVRAAVEELGFVRNDGAAMLRHGYTSSIGLVVEDVADPFYSSLTRALEDVALEEGHLLLTSSSARQGERERASVLALCARRVDGLVLVPFAGDHGYLAPEVESGLVAVVVDRPAEGIEVDEVVVDNAGGARGAVELLLHSGHRRIAFVGDDARIWTAQERLRGYREALASAGLQVDPRLVHSAPRAGEDVRAAVRAMLTSAEPPTAFFTGNSRFTVALLREAAELGVTPALVGWDDFELASLLSPSISVVAQDPATLGLTAGRLLFRRLAGDTSPVERVVLPVEVIARASSAIPPPER